MHLPKRLACMLVTFCFASGLFAASAETPPAIHIVFTEDNSGPLVPVLRMQYEQCAQLHRLYRDIAQRNPAALDKIDKPDSWVVNMPLAPEPDWARLKVGVFQGEEWFFGEKYAHVLEKKRYEFSRDGRCRLIETEEVRIEKDNARYRYRITLKDRSNSAASLPGAGNPPRYLRYRMRKVQRSDSPVYIEQQLDAEMREFADDPAAARSMEGLFTNPNGGLLPGASRGPDMHTIEDMKQALQLQIDWSSPVGEIPHSNDENVVAGQHCDIVSSGRANTRIWYWSKAHTYPSSQERSIVLKSEVNFGGKKVMEATRFELLERLDDAVFEPEPGLLQAATR
ncbi:MAG TPA: hypothetical protein ENJ79_10555 [Gammaproteobacteria bacterium]|nr:hypothetical protein [Gammaproteobacteria bacterium]